MYSWLMGKVQGEGSLIIKSQPFPSLSEQHRLSSSLQVMLTLSLTLCVCERRKGEVGGGGGGGCEYLHVIICVSECGCWREHVCWCMHVIYM